MNDINKSMVFVWMITVITKGMIIRPYIAAPQIREA